MIEIKTKLKKWGNSLGVVVPWQIIEKEGTKEGDEVTLLFKKNETNFLKDIFGTFKFDKSTEQIMDEIDLELCDE